MSDSWDDYAEQWDNNDDAMLYSKKAFGALIEVINLQGLDVLDFGCGTGLLTEKISPLANKVVALDSSKKMLSILNNKNLSNVTTVPESLSDDSIKNYTSLQIQFDLIVASSVFGFLPDFKATLIILKSLLAPCGLMVQWDWLSPFKESDFGLNKEKIESTYNDTGLTLLSINKAFSLTSSEGTLSVLMAVAKNNG